MTLENGLDEITSTVSVQHMGNILPILTNLQDDYIKSRLRLFWKLPGIRGITTQLIKLLFVPVETTFDIDKGTMTLTQKIMLVSVYKCLSRIIMKARI